MAAPKEFKEQDMEFVTTTIIPPLPTTERGSGIHLGGTTKIAPRIVYGSNEHVIIRSLKDTNDCSINSEHSVRCMVAKFSPNGEWVCSGDTSGQVAVWAHKSFVVKNTISVGKQCLDVSWSHDGQRIVAVGRGKEEKGKVFPWNTNNKLGELGGAQKGFLCCAFKPSRPFRVVTGSEDFGVYYYKGPPFKFESAYKNHKNYVNAVAFTPSGSHYVSASSDKTIAVFEAKTGKMERLIADGKGKKGQHKGTIYELSFNAEGTHFATSSADKTVKIWDFESGAVVWTFSFADKPTIGDMQVSVLWLGDYLVSLSLSGKINYLDPEMKAERPLSVVTGHRAGIMDCDFDAEHGALYTVDTDARVVRTDCASARAEDVAGGEVHGDPQKTQISFVRTACDGSGFWTVASNDTLCWSPIGGGDEKESEEAPSMGDKVVKLDGAARGCQSGNVTADLFVVATHKKKVVVFNGLDVVREWEVKYGPTCCAMSADDKLLAIGSGRDSQNAVYFYSVESGEELFVLRNEQYIRNEVRCLAMTADGAFLATADRDRAIWIWDLKEKAFEKPLNATKGMKFHGGLISSIQFSPNAPYRLLTAGNDSNLYLFTKPTEGRSENINFQHAFPGLIRKAMFLADDRIVAIGGDCSIRFMDIAAKQ